ncbi:hypothetical protein [Natronococcus sp. A-GB7]|uniref:hypothetical protein n=1 Tax=Natronococcus sp. A-GB7 TaxID=3037649 RepID=UPI00241FA8FF|nr:hypothetical protein [Natronococcus sp. A-GB7]MDG5820548.1 hypothetical protein [Natronococcus sp. A-GB7]
MRTALPTDPIGVPRRNRTLSDRLPTRFAERLSLADPFSGDPCGCGRRTLFGFLVAAGGTVALGGCTEPAAVHDAWGGVEEIVLEGDADGWRGLEPDAIAGERNPTLVLFENREYEITVKNGNGEPHAFVLRDADGAIIERHRTEPIETRGETQTLRVRADLGLAEYACGARPESMAGRIEVRTEKDTDVDHDG